MPVVIGVDAHKKTHTLVALDGNGRKLAEKTVEATDTGHAKALRLALLKFTGEELTWGIEDCRHVSARLERSLVDAGQRVARVPTRLMARARGSSRRPGKSDPIDAEAVARVVLREPDLPVACHDAVSRELKLLVDRREDLVGQRTATVNRIAWRIHELDPARSPGVLNYPKHRDVLREWLTGQSVIVAELALQELADITRLTEDIDALEKRITARVREVAPCLFGMPGCGALTAARIVGETALVTRFSAEPAFAQYAGLAPVPQWSGSTAGRMRRPKYGNRQLNSAVHRIAVTQLRLDGPGRAYYRKRLAEANDTRAMALRGTQTPSRPCGLRASARGLSQQATPLAGAPDGLIIRLIGTEHAAHQKISHDLDHAGAIMPICSQAYRSRRLWRPHCLQRGRRWWLRWSHTPIRVQRSVPAPVHFLPGVVLAH